MCWAPRGAWSLLNILSLSLCPSPLLVLSKLKNKNWKKKCTLSLPEYKGGINEHILSNCLREVAGSKNTQHPAFGKVAIVIPRHRVVLFSKLSHQNNNTVYRNLRLNLIWRTSSLWTSPTFLSYPEIKCGLVSLFWCLIGNSAPGAPGWLSQLSKQLLVHLR